MPDGQQGDLLAVLILVVDPFTSASVHRQRLRARVKADAVPLADHAVGICALCPNAPALQALECVASSR
ncbi:hypothetical protein [Xanthomonas bromi]|uniref:hypothetical protein n=1 Tax=Xanthomonas bromi TaxID=56449 RepID=UPI001428D1DD|nr:hypothetical protein [Xanthomonas bromi]